MLSFPFALAFVASWAEELSTSLGRPREREAHRDPLGVLLLRHREPQEGHKQQGEEQHQVEDIQDIPHQVEDNLDIPHQDIQVGEGKVGAEALGKGGRAPEDGADWEPR